MVELLVLRDGSVFLRSWHGCLQWHRAVRNKSGDMEGEGYDTPLLLQESDFVEPPEASSKRSGHPTFAVCLRRK